MFTFIKKVFTPNFSSVMSSFTKVVTKLDAVIVAEEAITKLSEKQLKLSDKILKAEAKITKHGSAKVVKQGDISKCKATITKINNILGED